MLNDSRVAIKPRETTGLLVNPGMGVTTFHSFNEDDRNNKVPLSSIAYFRYYWTEVEPEEGKINFEQFDADIENAVRNGQDYCFRVMNVSGNDPKAKATKRISKTPEWFEKTGAKGYPLSDGRNWVPDYSDPTFLKHHERLIRSLGERYNGHPDINHIDIGSIGLWGEWHLSMLGLDLPEWPVLREIVDHYLEYFDKTPKVILIGHRDALEYATANGCGWRADCLGDMGGFGSSFMHMNYYPEQLDAANANDAWMRGPVDFEVCWVINKWYEDGWDADWIFEEALRMHASIMNVKSSSIPAAWVPILNKMQKRMGYRLVLRELTYPKAVQVGRKMLVDMEWENVGVAPPYRPFTLAMELRGNNSAHRVVSDVDVRTWLPGKHSVMELFDIPGDLKTGTYEVNLALMDPAHHTPEVRLAIAGRADDGWYPLGTIEVTDDLRYPAWTGMERVAGRGYPYKSWAKEEE